MKLTTERDNRVGTNYPNDKRQQRDVVHAQVQSRIVVGIQCKVVVYELDEDLDGHLFAEELIQRFGDNSDVQLCVYAPNVKEDIVARLGGLAHGSNVRITTSVGCVCEFNRHWGAAMQADGGIDVAFVDVFGGFDNGACHAIQNMIECNLFAQKSDAYVCFAVSDLHDVLKKTKCKMGAVVRTIVGLESLFRNPNSAYTMALLYQADHIYSYGKTMHFYEMMVTMRAVIVVADDDVVSMEQPVADEMPTEGAQSSRKRRCDVSPSTTTTPKIQKRTCVVCGFSDTEPSIKILGQRFQILKQWYPLAQRVHDRAHTSCLTIR